ncbi:tRNA lysidine(34) synthetase TilS [Arsenicicoccus sp. UBA2120]|uniref:tRNA lysidine(34) synthetase TilS n=1 Tax=Arsenicicoccus sp. UBA2120 TaxID=1946055 RepID=UPI00257FBEC9|nr:tRNA lysidine(34) synthetase TilS [Arsenicicoccus sp. UBA2120]
MSRSRLDPVVARARNLVEPHLEPGAVVAVSGGADSLALAAVVAFFVRRRGVDARAVVVDHGLQAGSADVAARAVQQCEALGLPASVRSVDVRDLGTGPEDAARVARHHALRDAAGEAPILLAHTLDDQAETVLLGLGRGSGARSLRGMAPWDAPWGRPLLGVRAADTRAACRDLGLGFWEDPHNTDPAYARVRARGAMTVLEEALGPGIRAALARSADRLRADADALDALAADWLAEHPEHTAPPTTLDRPEPPAHVESATDPGHPQPPPALTGLPAHDLATLPAAVRTRVLRLAALAAGAPSGALTAAHVLATDRLLTHWRGQGPVSLPGHLAATRTPGRAGRIVIGPLDRVE